MKKSDIRTMPQFFDRYINLVEDIDVITALEKYAGLGDNEKNRLNELGDKRYAPGKWTVKDILQHIIDTERIMSYRAMRISRNDPTVLPGYDEELFGQNTNAVNRTIDDLLYEAKVVRESSILLFKSFNNEMLLREGICFNVSISPLALGFVIAGHPFHHYNVIKEKYYL